MFVESQGGLYRAPGGLKRAYRVTRGGAGWGNWMFEGRPVCHDSTRTHTYMYIYMRVYITLPLIHILRRLVRDGRSLCAIRPLVGRSSSKRPAARALCWVLARREPAGAW